MSANDTSSLGRSGLEYVQEKLRGAASDCHVRLEEDQVRYITRATIKAYEAAKLALSRLEERVPDAVRLGLNCCPKCGSGDVRWCNISVRPYCNECNHWGQTHYGTAEEAIARWNSL